MEMEDLSLGVPEPGSPAHRVAHDHTGGLSWTLSLHGPWGTGME